jgi:molybdenum cofactor synthesis domain-containing protein
MAHVLSVNISEKKGTIKNPVPRISLKPDLGIDGDAHAGNWHRQVSLLAQESADRMAAQGVPDLKPGIFAENITTQGIELFTLPVGTRIKVGSALLEVTQIGKECHQHCQIYQQVGMCVMPLEGIFARVLVAGEVAAGDEITLQPSIDVAVITISDRSARGERADLSGPALVKELQPLANVKFTRVIPDDLEQIKSVLVEMADEHRLDVVFTTGGTGFAPRDVTPEATLAVAQRPAPGITEAMRAASLAITNRAMLSRAVAGIRGSTLVINLPGSPKAAVECLRVFLPVMAHAVEMLAGGDHR